MTPPPSGWWEEENSLESVTEAAGRLDVGLDGLVEVEEEGSEDEIEYMPPKVVGGCLDTNIRRGWVGETLLTIRW